MRHIYAMTNMVNGLMYIGQTKNLRKRWNGLVANNNNQSITKAIQEYGKENFKMEVIETCEDEEADEREKYWIDKFNTFKGKGYNEHCGGRTLGKGEEHPRTGQETPEEVKEKMRQAMIENGTINNISGENHYLYGKKHTQEDLKKMRQWQRMDSPVDNKKKAIQIIKEYHETDVTQKELAERYGCHAITINRVINGRHWTMKDLNNKLG